MHVINVNLKYCLMLMFYIWFQKIQREANVLFYTPSNNKMIAQSIIKCYQLQSVGAQAIFRLLLKLN